MTDKTRGIQTAWSACKILACVEPTRQRTDGVCALLSSRSFHCIQNQIIDACVRVVHTVVHVGILSLSRCKEERWPLRHLDHETGSSIHADGAISAQQTVWTPIIKTAMLRENIMPAQREREKRKVTSPLSFVPPDCLFPLCVSAFVKLLLMLIVHTCTHTDAERCSVARITTPIEIESQQKEATNSTSYTLMAIR